MRENDQNVENHNIVIKPKVNLYTKSKIQKKKKKKRKMERKLFKSWKVIQCDGNKIGTFEFKPKV